MMRCDACCSRHNFVRIVSTTYLVQLHYGLDERDRLAGPWGTEDDEGGVVVDGVVGDYPADGRSLFRIGSDVLLEKTGYKKKL